MSETYQSKRERWQRMLELLPEGLREHISLRNVEAVADLTPQAQERLAEAIQAGLKRIPRAVEQLRINPNASLADLLHPPARPNTVPAPSIQPIPRNIQSELADLIQECFPHMPRISAEALANSDAMDAARTIAQAHEQLFRSNQLRTDFVMMALYGLVRQTLERLEEVIEATPALRQAFKRDNLPWNSNDRRRTNA